MNIKDTLQAIKDKSNLSDKEIAKRIGVSQPTITRIRNGTTSTGYECGLAIHAMAKEYGISVDASQ